MVSWRCWSGVLCLLAVFAACSGKSQGNKDEVSPGGAAGEHGDGGTTQTTGAAGDPGAGGASISVTGAGVGTATATGFTSVTTASSSITSTSASTGSVTTGVATTTGGPVVPAGWTCSVLAYENGACDCGCGVIDPDCSSDDLDECAVCNTSGSCNRGACPGKIDPEDVTRCIQPPEAWTCSEDLWHDQSLCHCGCGALDPDCASDDPAECDQCSSSGSCSAGICPGSIDESDNTTCFLPEGWLCPDYTYGNGLCDCGCGVLDRDCASASRDECRSCSNGCSKESCPGPIDADDNTICTGVPAAWSCADRFYDDGVLCHCGCGVVDPDCDSTEAAACDRCGFEGSCSRRECPGTIDPDNNAYCERPPAPDDWVCNSYSYGDGYSCDCGCGAVDIDCRTDSLDECSNCSACGSYSCPGRVDPDDIGACIPPPENWTCSAYAYGDGYWCDCGCGVLDPDCESALVSVCDNCYPNSGSCADDYTCRGVNAEDNSRCNDSPPEEWECESAVYGDGACDCGCGVRDLDCANGTVDVCEFCDVEGSCSDAECPGSISEDDNAVCTE